MYTQIDTNRRRTIGLLFLFFILLIGFGWALAYGLNEPVILPIAVVVAVIQAWSAYYYSDQISLAVAGARELTGTSDVSTRAHRAVENAAIAAGLPKPRLYLIEDEAINAFATGRDPQHAVIAVTRGAVERLNKRELEGVIAHEMSHIGNYDIRVMAIVVVLVGIIVLASDLFFRMTLYGSRSRDSRDSGNGIFLLIALALAILSPVFATLLQLSISRKREYLADASGALITRDPEGLASALEKIAADHDPLDRANNATAHLYIANPFKAADPAARRTNWVASLFNTHPPIEDRIRRLRAML